MEDSRVNSMSLIEQLEATASKVDRYILSLLKGKPRILYEASLHLIRTGGKRLRPFLVMKSYEIFNSDVKKAIPAAAALELLHNFTLVHDDIMDHDLIRHAAPTVHTKYGVPLAIVAGDLLFAKVFESIVSGMQERDMRESTIIRVLDLMIRSSIKVCEGQVRDLKMSAEQRFYSVKTYFDMIREKTAVLFETACIVGSIVGGATKEDEKAMVNFGRDIGIAFQLIDDILGVVGDPKITGKPVGSDLREGKKTYILSLAHKLATDDDKLKIRKVFGKREVKQEEIDEAFIIISKTGAVDKVRSKAESYADRALSILKRYPDSPSKKALSELTHFIVTRNL
ncbi:MAG: polyprenyl synthetase family protein [Candidatus Methylarchaceae archaeon HK01M]|nr:polyprenyl synthetase family protein [Candidatus Methylarchaceae archaeon HK01M]